MPIIMVEWGLGMNLRILALVFIIVALTATARAAQAGGGKTVEHNPALSPAAGQTNYDRQGAVAAAPMLSWVNKIKAVFNSRLVEENCLASAVYFEARSESQRGQLAVATVILNRVRAPHYPSTICGVIYQGASHLNACQFSFACDGEPDLPKQGRAWNAALEVAALALADDKKMEDEPMRMVSAATHYHADYAKPGWSKSLQRLTKIGRHIFYSQG